MNHWFLFKLNNRRLFIVLVDRSNELSKNAKFAIKMKRICFFFLFHLMGLKVQHNIHRGKEINTKNKTKNKKMKHEYNVTVVEIFFFRQSISNADKIHWVLAKSNLYSWLIQISIIAFWSKHEAFLLCFFFMPLLLWCIAVWHNWLSREPFFRNSFLYLYLIEKSGKNDLTLDEFNKCMLYVLVDGTINNILCQLFQPFHNNFFLTYFVFFSVLLC